MQNTSILKWVNIVILCIMLMRYKKENRKERFIKEFNSDILKYKGKECIVVSKISLKDLFDDHKSENILYGLLNSILKAMLLVERIGEEKI